MSKFLILCFILWCSVSYSQEQRFSRYDLFCEVEVFESDSNRWVISTKNVGCYGYFMNDNQKMIMMKCYNDSTDTFYEIIETKNEFMQWTYKSVNITTKEVVYFHYYRSVPDEYDIYYYDILRLDFSNHSIRYKKRQN